MLSFATSQAQTAVPARDRGPEAGEGLETRREREGLCSIAREAPGVSVQLEHPLEESGLLPTGPRVPELVDGTSTGCSRKRGCGRTGLSAHLHTGVQGGEGQSGAPSAWDHAWVQRPPLLPPPSPRVHCSLTFNILPRRPVSFPPGLAPSVRDQVPPPPDAAGRRGFPLAHALRRFPGSPSPQTESQLPPGAGSRRPLALVVGGGRPPLAFSGRPAWPAGPGRGQACRCFLCTLRPPPESPLETVALCRGLAPAGPRRWEGAVAG